MNQSLFVGFWNINLSPPISKKWNKSKVDKKIRIARVIEGLLKLNLDFLCLCEVSPEDIEFIDKSILLIGMGYDYNIHRKNYGGLYFDTCVIYKNIFDFVRSKVEVDGDEKNKLKVYQKYEFLSSHLNERFIFYVTHWLSQLSDNNEKRRSVASYIKKDTNDEKAFLKKTKCIVLGDFNVEPYDSAILEGLRSTRDQKVIASNASLFYNPFWKYLHINDDLPSGTHYCTKNDYHHWHVYDQILISGNFFRDGWNLEDKFVNVLDEEMIRALHNDQFDNPSDHSPIWIRMEKKDEF